MPFTASLLGITIAPVAKQIWTLPLFVIMLAQATTRRFMYTRKLALIFCWTLVVLFNGCSTDPTSSIPDSIEAPSCADKRLDGVPAQVSGATVAIEDRVESAPCADGAATGSQNLVTFFVAPQDGNYRFSTLEAVLKLSRS